MIKMGIVNLTPDSFWEPSRATTLEAVRTRIADLVSRGCSIIDLGAVSTRPGAADVPVEEEWRRLEPVLSWMKTAGFPSQDLRHPRLRGGTMSKANGGAKQRSCEAVSEGKPAVSIDTTSAEIVRRTFNLIGRFLVNDISAGEDDPEMLPTVAELDLPYIAMHKRGNPRSMDAMTDYPQGVVKAMDEYFEGFDAKAEALGIKDWILDPGFGFAKTAEQNWELLENLPAFRHFGRPILVGVADKRFTRTPNPSSGLSGSAYAERLAEQRGADILRIH